MYLDKLMAQVQDTELTVDNHSIARVTPNGLMITASMVSPEEARALIVWLEKVLAD